MLTVGRADVVDGMAGATPYLRILSTVVGGWLMARQALMVASAADTDSYAAAKLATARFYMTQILPTIDGLVAQVTASASPLYSISAAALASS
jgi:3-(methylthio)propanoyl-CoA dehydrogenase